MKENPNTPNTEQKIATKNSGTKIKTIVTEFIWEPRTAVSVEVIQYQGICIPPVLQQLFFFFFLLPIYFQTR